MPKLKPGENPPYPTVERVNIGYRPYSAVNNTVGRAGPGDQHKAIRALKPGKRVAFQSIPNPQLRGTDGSVFWKYGNNPPEHAGVYDSNGQLWKPGYSKTGGKTMWFKVSDFAPADWNCIGPKWIDYRCGVGWPRRKRFPRFIIGSKITKNRVKRVTSDEVYIRYARMSTAFGYLMKGDEVERLWSLMGFYYVRVISSNTIPVGKNGVVIGLSLGKVK